MTGARANVATVYNVSHQSSRKLFCNWLGVVSITLKSQWIHNYTNLLIYYVDEKSVEYSQISLSHNDNNSDKTVYVFDVC